MLLLGLESLGRVALALSSYVLACGSPPLVVTNAALWKPDGPTRGQELVIERGRISAMGAAGTLARPEIARVLDAKGALALPGLIDSHAHFVWPGPEPAGAHSAFETTARQTLASGVTTVRVHLSELGEGPVLARAGADDCFPAPRIELGGRGMVGGAPDLEAPLVWGVKDPEDARRKVGQVRESGATWLALHDSDRFTASELAAIVDQARREGLRLMASGDRFDEIREAIPAGAESLEYINRSTAPEYPSDLIELFVSRKELLYFVIPLGYYRRYMAYRGDPRAAFDPWNRHLMPDGFPDDFYTELERRFRGSDREPHEEALEASFPTLAAKFRQLEAAGLQLVVGSDSGSPGHFHADAIWWEMRAWRDLGGVAPAVILEAATERPARMLGRSDLGVLREGARGDLLLYTGDIGAGEFDVAHMRTVVKGGVVYVLDGEWVGPRE